MVYNLYHGHMSENFFLLFYFSCRCIIRFPSTQIKLEFQSLLEDMGPLQPMHSPALPLRVDTQLNPSPFVSPCPSPTGTIR